MNLERRRDFYNNPSENYSRRVPEQPLTREEERLLTALEKETDDFRQPVSEEFVGVYPSTELARDVREVDTITNKYESRSGERSDMVTRLLLHLVYDFEYLKPKDGDWEIHTGRTHSYDDKERGSDEVIVFYNRKTGEALPISVDTTTSIEPSKKVDKLKLDFEYGNLRWLKYYKSPVSGEAIGRQEMPHIVIGYSSSKTQEIAKIWSKCGYAAFAMLGLEDALRDQVIKQLRSQTKGIEVLAPLNKQTEMISRVERVVEVLSGGGIKKEATAQAVAPTDFAAMIDALVARS